MKVLQRCTEDGQTIYIEVADDQEVEIVGSSGGGSVAGGEATAISMIEQLEVIADTIADVCRVVRQRVDEKLQEAMPSELTLEFGVKLVGEAGIPCVTKGSVEGSLLVTAKWEAEAKSGGK